MRGKENIKKVMKLYDIVEEQEKKYVSIIQKKKKTEQHTMMIDRPSRIYKMGKLVKLN
jgi:hypothetical protein